MVLEDLCILCYKNQVNSIEIFSERGVQLNIAAILSKHFWFEVKVVHHLSRRICANCWASTNDFHAFYQSIEQAQNEYIADASIDDVEECTRLAPSTAAMAAAAAASAANSNCNNGNDDGNDVPASTAAAAFKATIMQNDAVNLNRLNATILETDKTLDDFDATNVNYEIPVCELPSNDDIVQNIIRDDVLHMEMHCVTVDDANPIDETDNNAPVHLQYLTDNSTVASETTPNAVMESENIVVIGAPIQCISIVPAQACTTSNLLSHQQMPTSAYMNAVASTDGQIENLPRFNKNQSIKNTILSESTSTNQKTYATSLQSLPVFNVLLSQQYPTAAAPSAPATDSPLQSEQTLSPADRMFCSNILNDPARQNLPLPLATMPESPLRTSSLSATSPEDNEPDYETDAAIAMEILPPLDENPPTALEQTLLDDVQFGFPFRMDDLYRASPSADSGYSPSQSTTSGHTPQYFPSGQNPFDSSRILNSPMVTTSPATSSASEESPPYVQSMRLPSFSPSVPSIGLSDSPMHLPFSETASVHSVDSGHPCDSPLQQATSPFSLTSPIPRCASDSPMQFVHRDDNAMACTLPAPLLSPSVSHSTHVASATASTSSISTNHVEDDDISLDIDSLLIFRNAQATQSNRTRSALDEFNDVSSGSFDSYEKLLNANELPLKLPQVTDADLKQALQSTNCMNSSAATDLPNARCTKLSQSAEQPAPLVKKKPVRKPKIPKTKTKTTARRKRRVNAKAIEPTDYIDLTKEPEISRQNVPDKLAKCKPSIPVATKEPMKSFAGLAASAPSTNAVRPIISIIPIRPTANSAVANNQSTTAVSSISEGHAKIFMDLRRLTECNSMSIETISVPTNATTDNKRNITMGPNRLEISVVNVAIKDAPPPVQSGQSKSMEEMAVKVNPNPIEMAMAKEIARPCAEVVPNEKCRPVGKVIPNEKPRPVGEVAPIEKSRPSVAPIADMRTIAEMKMTDDQQTSEGAPKQRPMQNEAVEWTEGKPVPREELKLRLKRVTIYEKRPAAAIEPPVKLRKLRKRAKSKCVRVSVRSAPPLDEIVSSPISLSEDARPPFENPNVYVPTPLLDTIAPNWPDPSFQLPPATPSSTSDRETFPPEQINTPQPPALIASPFSSPFNNPIPIASATNPLAPINPRTIELSSIQSATTTNHSRTLSPTPSHNSGKLQLLCDRMRKCSVILERIDDMKHSGNAKDLSSPRVQNNKHKLTITIPKQYAINANASDGTYKSRRIQSGDAGLPMLDRKIMEVCQLICEICQRRCRTVSAIFEHYRREHQLRGYLRCCKKKFISRGPLLEHIESHDAEPQAYRCKICQKSVPSKRRLKEHTAQKHLRKSEKIDCDQCPKQFDSKWLLDQHVIRCHSADEDKLYICDQCGQRFAHLTFLNSHIDRVHNMVDAHLCEICSKMFKKKADFVQHQLMHNIDAGHRETPRLTCDICGAHLKNENSMRKHMERHGDSEHVCQLCDRVYYNRLSLDEHMRYMHSESDHSCTSCPKKFRTVHQLKEHMAQHTGETVYNCPYCNKPFNSNSNLYKHKRMKHLVEFNRDRVK